MDYSAQLVLLELLKEKVDAYVPLMYKGTDEGEVLHEEICRIYGQVADVYTTATGNKSIVIDSPKHGGGTYANFFEAGFLSGRTFHTHQGKTELLTVLGKVKMWIEAESKVKLEVGPKASGNKVFLVHGHNQSVLQTCARFIEKLDLPLTILSEEANKGRTIFQKFVDHSDAGFAVVLLTADDRGGRVGQSETGQSLRARQNVIFELGFFIGKLGVDKVCALYEEGVEIPSDYHGVAFVPLDERQAWKFELAKEMKAAGLPVDLNKVLS